MGDTWVDAQADRRGEHLFEYVEAFYHQQRRNSSWARSIQPRSNDAAPRSLDAAILVDTKGAPTDLELP